MKYEFSRQTPEGLLHPFDPVFDARSKALVLGSFPSVKSRENAFYYGHPQSRFWPVLAALFSQRIPQTIPEKTEFLHLHHIALWDMAETCTIKGSADSTLSLRSVNDIPALIAKTDVSQVFANGQLAGRLYKTHAEHLTGLPIRVLPSTSPANAAWTLDKLIGGWQPLLEALRHAGNHPV
ncbi:MAG: DNA-deoxyinosine glycosylase [Firmicutes bacterium]|nr:DNA-deoxyinosine glycosylase [Bacillota bacterium]